MIPVSSAVGKRTTFGSDFVKYIVLGVVIIGGVLTLIPFIWMIVTSLKDQNRIFVWPPEWIPNPVKFDNYKKLWVALNFTQLYQNSLKIAFFHILGQLLSCSMGAYAFSRLRFPGRDLLFMLLLATMMIPGQVTMVPVFVIIKNLGWVDTHLPFCIPPFLAGAFGIFFLRQYMLTLPVELEEAAKIDGCSYLRIYWQIILPLTKPALAAFAIFSFMGTWNDFLGPLIYLNSPEKFTIPLGLTLLSGLSVDMPLLMAATVVSMIPILLIYVFCQKYFIQGIVMTGLKV